MIKSPVEGFNAKVGAWELNVVQSLLHQKYQLIYYMSIFQNNFLYNLDIIAFLQLNTNNSFNFSLL